MLLIKYNNQGLIAKEPTASNDLFAGSNLTFLEEYKFIMVKILIVDDSIFSQKITANLIKKYLPNVEIFFANDGQDGLVKYKEINPDYTFSDLLMPRLNGKELICAIREFNKDAKIIVLSADVQKNVREEINLYNIMSFINKPFSEEKAQFICEMIRNDK